MALTRKSATLGANNNGAATWTVTTNEATATAIGDVVLVVHSNDYYLLSNMSTPSATGAPTMNAISGATADGGNANPHILMWWYVANTAGAQVVTFTESGLHDEERAGFVVVYGGADPINPIDGAAGTTLQTSSTSCVAPAVTTTFADNQVLAYIAGSGSPAPTFTSPGTLTEIADWVVGAFGGGTAGAGVLSATGSTGTFTFTATQATAYVAATVAIKAARPVLAYSEAVYSAASNLNSLVSSAFTVSNGDVIVVKTSCEDQSGAIPGTPTATGQTFTDKNTDSTTNLTGGHIYAAVVTGNPGTLTVTSPWSGTAAWHSAVFERWTSAQLAATPATNSTKNAQSANGFSGLITTAAADSVVTWSAGDWTPNAPGTPGYRSGAIQDGLHDKYSTNSYVAYFAYQFTAAAGSQTFGLTTPAGTSAWKFLAMEIQYLGSSAAPPVYPFELLTPTPRYRT